MKKLLLLAFLLLASVSWADVATLPTDLSAGDVGDWTIRGGHIGSGTALPAVASAPIGARFTDLSNPITPVEYRNNGASWIAVSGGGSADTSGLQPIASMSFYQPTASMSDYLLATTAATEYVGSSAFAAERDNRIASEAAIAQTVIDYIATETSNRIASDDLLAVLAGSYTQQFAVATPVTAIHAVNYGWISGNAALLGAANVFSAAQTIPNASITGNLSVNGYVEIATGSSANLSFRFKNDSNTGIFSYSADRMDLVTGGTSRIQVDANYVTVTRPLIMGSTSGKSYITTSDPSPTAPSVSWLSDTTCGFGRYSIGRPCVISGATTIQAWATSSTQIFTPASFSSSVSIGTTTAMTGYSLTVGGQASDSIYCGGDVSALSFTDRSDAPDTLEQALEIIQSHESKNGKINHAVLSPLAWGRKTRIETTGRMVPQTKEALVQIPMEEQEAVELGKEPVTTRAETVTEEIPETIAVEEPDQSKRNLSMVVSAQALVIKDLERRLKLLEEK